MRHTHETQKWAGHACPACRNGILLEQPGQGAEGWEIARCSRCSSQWQRYPSCPCCAGWQWAKSA